MLKAHAFFVAVIFVCGCEPRAMNEEMKKKAFGGADNFELMNVASTVTACRLKHEEAAGRYVEPSEYEEGDFTTASSAQVDRLKTVLADPTTYLVGGAKTCGHPIYGVRLRFQAHDGTIDLNLCFKCDDLAATRDGKLVGAADFHRARRKLVTLCKELFPNDAEIQNLNER